MTTRFARFRGPAPPRRTDARAVITKSARAQHTWWYGRRIRGSRRVMTVGTGTRHAGPTVRRAARREGGRRSVFVGRGLDELDEHAPAVLGVDEVDPRVRGATPAGVI